jgi:hypothetical protein
VARNHLGKWRRSQQQPQGVGDTENLQQLAAHPAPDDAADWWETEYKRQCFLVAESCLSVQKRVFELWHLFRGGGCSRAQMDDGMPPLMLELLDVLHAGLRCRDGKTKRFCARLLKLYPTLWTFVVIDGVEPTSNHAERVQRRAVLCRRRSFGCHSAAGCRFVERILTVVQTLRLQHRSVLSFLHQAIEAHRSGLQAPALMLEGSSVNARRVNGYQFRSQAHVGAKRDRRRARRGRSAVGNEPLARVVPVPINSGIRAMSDGLGGAHVPKTDLVAVVKSALQNQILHVPASLPLAQVLIHELETFTVQITGAGNETLGANNDRSHDNHGTQSLSGSLISGACDAAHLSSHFFA